MSMQDAELAAKIARGYKTENNIWHGANIGTTVLAGFALHRKTKTDPKHRLEYNLLQAGNIGSGIALGGYLFQHGKKL